MADRRHILLVEDDPAMREALADALRDLGMEVETACDGLEALERLASTVPLPAAVLLDLHMPRLDGEGLLRAIRADAALRDLPVVTMSGSDDGPDLHVEARLRKPFDIPGLARILASLCE